MIRENVQPGSTVYTDGHGGYIGIDKVLPCTHESVSHYTGEYVRGEVHSNTAESWFSLLKRGMMGTFHSVSRKHLFRYCDEFAFRWDTNKLDDGARTELAIRQAQGKRLRYVEPA